MSRAWYDSTKMCKGCNARSHRCNTPVFYFKHHTEFICPCSECLVKVLCNTYCNLYYEYENRYKKQF